MNWAIISTSFLISCIISFILLPLIKKWVQEKKELSEDRNKFKKPRITSLEGLISILIFFLTMSIILAWETLAGNNNLQLDLIFTGLLTIAVISFIGFVDDILGFPKRIIKNIFFIFALVPILAALFNQAKFETGSIINATVFFSIIIAPAAIALSSYSVNAIKSFNKVNLTSGLIIVGALFVSSLIKNALTAMVMLAALAGIFLFLQLFNYTNFKISLGRVGRMSFGATIAIAAIFSKSILPLFILLMPFIIYSLTYKKSFDKEQKLMIARGAKNNSPEQKAEFENIFLYMTLSEIICAVIAILIQI